MLDTTVVAFSQDESLADIIADFMTFDGLPTIPHTSKASLFPKLRSARPDALVIVQPFGDRTWLVRLAETLHWDPELSTRIVVAAHNPHQFRPCLAANTGYIAAVLPVPIDFNQLARTTRAVISSSSTGIAGLTFPIAHPSPPIAP